jgi:hypothetical protein
MPTIDIIGDIHSYADKLRQLLTRLGYRENGGVYSHPEHIAIFVGDLDVTPVTPKSGRVNHPFGCFYSSVC